MKSLILFVSLLLTSCTIVSQTNELKSIEGVWESVGYGRVVEVKKNKIYLYDICKVNCNQAEVIPGEVALNVFDIAKLNDSVLLVQSGINQNYFNKINSLPVLCSKEVKDKKDPFYNFETLWQTFNENYCYFEERNIDWAALKGKYQSQIKASTKPLELFLLMNDMIDELNDGHSFIQVPDDLAKDYQKYQDSKREVRRAKILDSLGQDYKLPSINVDSIRLKMINSYVKEVKTYNFGILNYGLINDEVAMVQINGMDQFANYNIPSDISGSKAERLYEKYSDKSDNYTLDNANGAAYIINKVVSEIKNTKVCIIDIRFNGGGFDDVQLEILKRFATQEGLVVTKKARTKKGFTAPSEVYLSPTKNAYKGQVYILTSPLTASAAEDFTLCAMSAIPNAIRVGSNTTGIFSDILEKKLPNGWEFGLSNEVYESPDGISYEAIGIPPHHFVEYPKKGYWFYKQFYDNKTGKDEAIEVALKLIEN